MTINLLNDLTNLNITDFEFEDLKDIGDGTGYNFTTIKLKVLMVNPTSISDFEHKDLYIKMIRKDRIKESIFCYWTLLYEEMFKSYEQSEFTSIINKVRIKETENEENKHSVLLEIMENKWKILECGSTIHLVKFSKYLNKADAEKSKQIYQWKNYIEDENQDVLFIGIVN